MGGLTKQSKSACVVMCDAPSVPKPHCLAQTSAALIMGLKVAHANRQFICPLEPP